jgi:HSP20 family protein
MQYWQPSGQQQGGGDVMSLTEALDDISEEKFVRYPTEHAAMAESYSLALDVLETADVFEIHASVPGVAPEAIDITVSGDIVRIAGERATFDSGRVSEESDYRWLVRERPLGRFDRTVTLPNRVIAERATADFIDGVLVVTVPKADAPRGRKIPVRAGHARSEQADVIEVDGSR